MKTLITCDVEKCEGCNRCIRVCPVSEANIAYLENGKIKVKIDNTKCINCGGCIDICQHNAREYEDDTEYFFNDLRNGEQISLIIAPAGRSNFKDWKKILAWLRKLGVVSIYDVSLGADICTWAHIRFIEKNHPGPIITQPCPAIVNYVSKYQPDLIKNLSPIHSPMLCTAVLMRKFMEITNKIGALSPCIAKSDEFEDTNLISYNITFSKLQKYIVDNHIYLPDEDFEFDHFEASLGKIYSMPGGLKENVEFYLGKKIRIDKSEGREVVYKNIDLFAKENPQNLPAIFDVLNCSEGCNIGTACDHETLSIFKVNKTMDDARQASMDTYKKTQKAQMTEVFDFFDKSLNLDDYKRTYVDRRVDNIPITSYDVENAFTELEKFDDISREHNCFACGSETCLDMAEKMAKGINISENCIEKTRSKIEREHEAFIVEHKSNLSNVKKISDEVSQIKNRSDNVTENLKDIEIAIEKYAEMSRMISTFSRQINLLSLNATIEAARIGNAGNAFAVVVSEIRKLALESQESVKSVEDTSKFADETISKINKASADVQESINKAFDYFVSISN